MKPRPFRQVWPYKGSPTGTASIRRHLPEPAAHRPTHLEKIMTSYLHCISHSPVMGFFDPDDTACTEIQAVIEEARQRIASFAPELVILFTPDHYNGFFYDIMPSFCIGMAAHAIGDFGSLAGPLLVPQELAESCARAVLDDGIDAAVSYRMQL